MRCVPLPFCYCDRVFVLELREAGTKSRSTAVRFELTRVTPIDFESIALTARPSCQTEWYSPRTQIATRFKGQAVMELLVTPGTQIHASASISMQLTPPGTTPHRKLRVVWHGWRIRPMPLMANTTSACLHVRGPESA